MNDEIKIDYEAVYSKCTELRQRLQNEMRETETQYRTIQQSLRGLDSRTNGEIMLATQQNQAKAQMVADTVQRLLQSIESATRATEQEERQIKQMFNFRVVKKPR